MMANARAILSAYFGPSDHYLPAYPGEPTIREIEQRYAVTLPEDFRAYLLEAAPMQDYYDDRDISWWAPAKIRNIPEEYPHPISDLHVAEKTATYLFFADFLLWACAWAICCDEGEDRGKVALIGGSPDRIVAGSFTEFVEAAVRDPLSVS